MGSRDRTEDKMVGNLDRKVDMMVGNLDMLDTQDTLDSRGMKDILGMMGNQDRMEVEQYK